MQKIPTTIITGFLGTGKTTFIRNLIENSNKKLALLINEFGSVGLDKDIITGCQDEDCPVDNIIELANGCICCTVADDFLPALESILQYEDKPDHIIIETSGLALPKPLVQAFQWPSVRHQVTVDGVITLLDAEAMMRGIFNPHIGADGSTTNHENPLEELFEDQLSLADIAILNKCDLISDAQQDTLIEQLKQHEIHGLRDGTPIIKATHGKVSPAIILGLDSQLEDNLDKRPSNHDGDIEHDHDDFYSFSVTLPNIAALDAKIEQLLANYPIYRMKGFLAHENKNMREVLQVAGKNINKYFDRAWEADEEKASHIIIIGAKELTEVEATITNYLNS